MKNRRRFLFKVLLFGALLFIFVVPLEDLYNRALIQVIFISGVRLFVPESAFKAISGSSIAFLTFLSLSLATPAIAPFRRAWHILAGAAVIIVLDLFVIIYSFLAKYGILAGRVHRLEETSLLFEFFRNLNWMLPFVLWVTLNRQFAIELLSPKRRVG